MTPDPLTQALRLFINNDASRSCPYIFGIGSWVCATDMLSFAAIEKRATGANMFKNFNTKESKLMPILKALEASTNQPIITKFTLDRIQKLLADFVFEKCHNLENCAECEAAGVVKVQYSSKAGKVYKLIADCPYCDGTGTKKLPGFYKWLSQDNAQQVNYKGILFDAYHFKSMLEAAILLGANYINFVGYVDHVIKNGKRAVIFTIIPDPAKAGTDCIFRVIIMPMLYKIDRVRILS